MITATTASHEALYEQARNGSVTALWRLCVDYKPLFISESRMYKTAMGDIYDTDDWISLGNILVWEIVSKGNFDAESGAFGAYLKQSVKFRFSTVWDILGCPQW